MKITAFVFIDGRRLWKNGQAIEGKMSAGWKRLQDGGEKVVNQSIFIFSCALTLAYIFDIFVVLANGVWQPSTWSTKSELLISVQK